MNVELISYTTNPEETIAGAARICYDSPVKDIEGERKFIGALIRSGHTATIEHASASFMISGVSRALTHQLVRHRLASYCQRSQRYVKENEPKYIIPDAISSNDEALKLYTEHMKQTWDVYKKLLDFGIKAENARMVLPNSCETKIAMSANFREWRSFLKLRLSIRAQDEIRKLANMILDKLCEIAPSCFEDLRNPENIQNT